MTRSTLLWVRLPLPPSDCRSPPSPARMAEAGRAHGLLNTFLRLNKSFKKASMNIISDSDGHLQVTITVTIVGQADQAPRRGGWQSNNQERGPGTRVPSPAAPSTPPLAHAPTPAPARRASSEALEPVSETRGGGWLRLSQTSSF